MSRPHQRIQLTPAPRNPGVDTNHDPLPTATRARARLRSHALELAEVELAGATTRSPRSQTTASSIPDHPTHPAKSSTHHAALRFWSTNPTGRIPAR
jgi:hypothetical protein